MEREPGQKHISTSLVERQNLTMRMGMRRFTHLTNAFSKKAENHRAAVGLHFAHYNFVRQHKTIRMNSLWRQGWKAACGPWKNWWTGLPGKPLNTLEESGKPVPG